MRRNCSEEEFHYVGQPWCGYASTRADRFYLPLILTARWNTSGNPAEAKGRLAHSFGVDPRR